MDIDATLKALMQRSEALIVLLARLEVRLRTIAPRNPYNRGRKNMPPDERLEVSRRMKAYWAARRRGDAVPVR
jgi:hypothetical protein